MEIDEDIVIEAEVSEEDDESLATEAPKAHITIRRKIRDDLEETLPKPYLARALIAPDVDHPKGTVGHSSNGMSVLQQHVRFFDFDNDGIIFPKDTYDGMRSFGIRRSLSLLLATMIHLMMSYATLPGWLPNLKFPIYVDRIHRAKHGSDSAIFDTEGRFMPVNLENAFSKFARTEPDKLTFMEMWRMTQDVHMPFDFFGWVLAKAEWVTLFQIAKDEQGFLTKEATRKCYDGSLFLELTNKKGCGDRKNK